MAFPPERIVCLTEETVETLYLLGEADRIVGVSGYAVRPPQVRREKPRVSAYTSADVPKICALEPDLVLAFSDLQADIVAELIRAGLSVHCFNQRSVTEILTMIRLLGGLVGAVEKGASLVNALEARLEAVRRGVDPQRPRPRVYFEEWNEPPITAIRWVSELIEIAGGEDIFAESRGSQGAKGRIVEESTILAREPDIILASWCGKKVRPERIAAREGWAELPAVRDGRIYEIKSPLILQPGPAALTDGLEAIVAAVSTYHQSAR